jgi:hypothetical protein
MQRRRHSRRYWALRRGSAIKSATGAAAPAAAVVLNRPAKKSNAPHAVQTGRNDADRRDHSSGSLSQAFGDGSVWMGLRRRSTHIYKGCAAARRLDETIDGAAIDGTQNNVHHMPDHKQLERFSGVTPRRDPKVIGPAGAGSRRRGGAELLRAARSVPVPAANGRHRDEARRCDSLCPDDSPQVACCVNDAGCPVQNQRASLRGLEGGDQR